MRTSANIPAPKSRSAANVTPPIIAAADTPIWAHVEHPQGEAHSWDSTYSWEDTGGHFMVVFLDRVTYFNIKPKVTGSNWPTFTLS